MKISTQTILVNCNGRSSAIEAIPGRRLLALETIRSGLAERGYPAVSMFPIKEPMLFGPWLADPKDVMGEFGSLVDPSKKLVIGLSTTTDDYFKFEQLSQLFRKTYPGSLIVGGGPHFKRENVVTSAGIRFRDPVEVALQEKLCDAAVVGHCSPFLDLLTEHDCDLGKVTAPGFYFLDGDGNVKGHGTGKYPVLGRVPYVEESEDSYGIIISSTCHNACGYCSVDRRDVAFSPELAAGALKSIAGLVTDHYIKLSFDDPNAFEAGKQDDLMEIIKQTEPEEDLTCPAVLKTISLDPSLLTEAGGRSGHERAELIINMLRHGFYGFFFGREVLSGDTAEAIGSNLKGRPKTQEQLDDEREALEGFVKILHKWRENYPYPPGRLGVTLSYILTPFETKGSALALCDEMERFEDMSDDDVMVFPQLMILNPLPGTPVRKKYADFIVDPENFAQDTVFANSWSYRLGRGAMLLEEMVPVITKSRQISQLAGKEHFYNIFRDVVEHVFSPDYKELTDDNRPSRRLVMVAGGFR